MMLPVSGSCCVICNSSPADIVYVTGTFASEPATFLPALIAFVGLIVTLVAFCVATIASDGLPSDITECS